MNGTNDEIPWKLCNTTADAHEKAVWQVLKYGNLLTTQDNQKTLELDDSLVVKIKNPLTAPRRSPLCEFTETMMQSYIPQILKVIPGNLGFDYLYSNRMKDFYRPQDGKWIGNGDGAGLNQIDLIIKAITEANETRRAVAVLWSPNHDPQTKNPPCLNHVQFFVRKNPEYPNLPARVNMRVLFRSHDIRGAYGANLYGLAELQKEVAAAVGHPVGHMTVISNSPHIYINAQYNDVVRWKLGLEKKFDEVIRREPVASMKLRNGPRMDTLEV